MQRGLWKLKAGDRVATWDTARATAGKTFTDCADKTDRQCVAAIGKRY